MMRGATCRVRIPGKLPRAIAIGTPSYDGKVTVPFCKSMMRLQRFCALACIRLQWLKRGGIVDQARDGIASHFLHRRSMGDVLIWIDADEGFSVRAVFDVARLAETLDVVGCSYPCKEFSWRTVWQAAQRIPEHMAAEVLPRVSTSGQVLTPSNTRVPIAWLEPLQCDRIGTGFLAVHRRVFERIAAAHPELAHASHAFGDRTPHFAFHWPVLEDGVRLGEDYSFCHRWLALGGKCWALLWHNIVHTGTHDFVDDAGLRAALELPMKGDGAGELVAPT